MSNHIIGNWFVSLLKMRSMSNEKLNEISINENYRETTRRNARLVVHNRIFNKIY